jgi:hypothetical protein
LPGQAPEISPGIPPDITPDASPPAARSKNLVARCHEVIQMENQRFFRP